MTRKEVINQLQDARDGYKEYLTDEALDIAIKALEQEPILDKIRAEIESIELLAEYTRGDIKRMALDILDKYKTESEG